MKLSRLTYYLGRHPLTSLALAVTAPAFAAGWFLADLQRANTSEALARYDRKTIAAEDIGRRCALDSKRPLQECVEACSAVDGRRFGDACEKAAKQAVLGNRGPAKVRPAPKVSVVAAELDGGPQK